MTRISRESNHVKGGKVNQLLYSVHTNRQGSRSIRPCGRLDMTPKYREGSNLQLIDLVY
jgi:hypothetical protein